MLTYSFGLVKWSQTDLENLNRLTRRTLTKFRYLHPKSATERLYLPRKEGGRGLIDIAKMCKNQVQSMRDYFLKQNNALINEIVNSDQAYTPLNLNSHHPPDRPSTVAENIGKWKDKVLHGRYPNQLCSNEIDKKASLTFLNKGDLHPETEGFIMAIQDKVIRTRNYEKNIFKINIPDRCRKCGSQGETIEHITGSCPRLANSAYLERHNQVAGIIHQHLALKHNLVSTFTPYYKYSPLAVLENREYILYWDRPVITDRPVQCNRPDIILIEKTKKTASIIDITIPLTHNIVQAEQEKIDKYANLAVELKNIWQLDHVTIYPVAISVDGIITERLEHSLISIGLPKGLITPAQKSTILYTCHIVRKTLSLGSD